MKTHRDKCLNNHAECLYTYTPLFSNRRILHVNLKSGIKVVWQNRCYGPLISLPQDSAKGKIFGPRKQGRVLISFQVGYILPPAKVAQITECSYHEKNPSKFYNLYLPKIHPFLETDLQDLVLRNRILFQTKALTTQLNERN